MKHSNKTTIAAASGLIAYYTLVISCLFLGCYTHNTAAYACIASIVLVAIAVCLGIVWLKMDVDLPPVMLFLGTFLICGGLYGGFLGYTWDNFCLLAEEPMFDAPVDAPLNNPHQNIFVFRDDVYLLSSFTESYDSGSDNWFAAPIVECPNNTSPNDGTCPAIGKKIESPAMAIKYDYSFYAVGSPHWDTRQKEAVKIKRLMGSYSNSVVRKVRDLHGDRILFPDGAPSLWWGSIDDAKKKWRGYAIGTLVGAIISPLLFPFVLLCVVLGKK